MYRAGLSWGLRGYPTVRLVCPQPAHEGPGLGSTPPGPSFCRPSESASGSCTRETGKPERLAAPVEVCPATFRGGYRDPVLRLDQAPAPARDDRLLSQCI